jgi:hypothetical protein
VEKKVDDEVDKRIKGGVGLDVDLPAEAGSYQTRNSKDRIFKDSS